MRIAISGAHYTGKSTLVEDLVEVLPKYLSVEEPYHLMEEDGYEFMGSPTLEDFEQQLMRSFDLLSGKESHIIFDRCPIDFLGYALSLPDSESFDLEEWLPRVQKAVDTLDLVIFVPVEVRDSIFVPRSADRDFRLDVDEKLRDIILDDRFDLDIEVLEVSGNRNQRRDQVLTRITQ
jgi:predicted ATPase